VNLHSIKGNQGVVAARDPRLDRVKIYVVPMAAVVMMLNQNGTRALKIEGWTASEDEGQILTYVMAQLNGELMLMITVYSPHFPLVLQDPPLVPISGEWRSLPDGIAWDDLLHAEAPDAEA